ncbi:hypothetical protein LINPERHAP1_LOCUS12148 [Linum perenne]
MLQRLYRKLIPFRSSRSQSADCTSLLHKLLCLVVDLQNQPLYKTGVLILETDLLWVSYALRFLRRIHRLVRALSTILKKHDS